MDHNRNCEIDTVFASRRRAVYLIRLAVGYLLLIFALGLCISCELASVFAWAIASDQNEVQAFAGAAVLFASGGLGWRMFRSTIDRVSRMPYVPSVREQIAALAAESILVRGSVAPSGDRYELLRAGPHGELLHPEELLRAGESIAEVTDTYLSEVAR